MAFVKPDGYSRSSLDKSGERFREGKHTSEDVRILDNWRASHLWVINVFQSRLRQSRKREFDARNIVIAQRLKRQPTIVDKLSREPGMLLSRMHDIAGCRIIFDDVKSLEDFRKYFHKTRAQHDLLSADDRYNYLKKPKPSGYRGVHDVYKFKLDSGEGSKWNGLRIELQYRTRVQHSWATAVEISDILHSRRLKFGDAEPNRKRQFVLAAEILARGLEQMSGHCSGISISDLVSEFDALERRTNIIRDLENVSTRSFTQFAKATRFFVLVNIREGERAGETVAHAFESVARASERYPALEKEYEGRADVVLVGAGEQDAIRLAYTNYFADAGSFLRNLRQARSAIAA